FRTEENRNDSNDMDVSEPRVERGIFPDAQERYKQTLADGGLEQLQDLGNNVVYPTLDQWVTHRIANKRGAKFFPSFVKNEEGEVFFCKTQLSDNAAALEGLAREAERLKNIPQGINSPRLVKYIPAEDGKVAMLLTEAINASVVHPDGWFPEDVPDIIRQIKLMEDEVVKEGTESKDSNIIENTRNLLKRAGETIAPDLQSHIESVLAAYEPYSKPRFVHGDAGTKNILLGIQEGEGAAFFVDWEFPGMGFLGQDAAKLWSELRTNKDVSSAFLNSYLHTPNGSLDQARKSAIVFGVLAESLVHLAWRNENIIAPGKQADSPHLQREIENFNQKIRDAIEAVESINT
ncbi:MAG TPA: phosphotransferase, partial [Candidatus Andersenbacteria bacterium]|nr:phosphotransferase [Candidatus Andersenbacteria bacterium]